MPSPKKLNQKTERTFQGYQNIALILRIYIVPKKNKNIEIIFVCDISTLNPLNYLEWTT